ncbi:MAG TPA: site-specific DNA-methyltransferase [Paludibacter sp.]
MVKDQVITDQYAIYNSDCMFVLPTLENDSIDLCVYSPPFAGLYNYSSSENDFSNCESKEQFLVQYEFLVKEISRVMKPGRITAVHCQDILLHTTQHNIWDFPHEIIQLHLKYGFTYNNRITIWKEPLEVRNRTMVNSLKHKQLCEDSTKCYTAMPDYLLIFRKAGENAVPVVHEYGLFHYAGANPILEFSTTRERSMLEKYGEFENIKARHQGSTDGATNKLSHVIWQRYASSVWDDIRSNNVMQFKESREEDDEKHVHPLQLDVIDRIVDLYSNKGEVVLTPFMGVGSEVYSPVSMGRKAIGIELKESYYKQAVKNLADVKSRFLEDTQQKLF